MMMMKWGLDKADAMGLDSFVEATEAGYELYKATGFITVDDFWADAKTDTPTDEWKRFRIMHPPRCDSFYIYPLQVLYRNRICIL